MSGKSKYGNGVHTTAFIRGNIRKLQHLPPPDEEWLHIDIGDEIPKGMVSTLISQGIITRVGEVYPDDRSRTRSEVGVYSTNKKAYDAIQSLIEERNGPLPCCKLSSIKNERGVDGITCGHCGTIHKREDLDI